MAVGMSGVVNAALGELRTQPVEWRVRAVFRDLPVVDTDAARLVWEPRRVVSAYAVPVADLAGRLVPAGPDGGRVDPDASALPPVLSPRNPFAQHSTRGTAYDLETDAGTLAAAAFVPDDPDLQGYAVLDWEAFTTWFEEDQEAVGHPREPHHRIRCLPSRRHVVVSVGGEVVADTHRPVLLVETGLPPRWYLPRDDVRMDLLTRSETRTTCAYKGHASYWSTTAGGTDLEDIAWSYEDPRHDADEVRDLLCFYAEHTDTVVDGQPLGRPDTEWSRHRT
jgi:uncharacterized protein (DUF427 family)